MRKLKFRQSDGTIIEIEVPEGATPVGFIAEDAHATQLEHETKRSYSRGKKKAGEELLQDQEFRTRALSTWGVSDKAKSPVELLEDAAFKTKALAHWGVSADANRQPSAEQVQQLRAQWDREVVEPLKKDLETRTSELESERERQLAAEIVSEARRLKYLDSLTEHPAGQPEKAQIVTLFRSRLAFDPETRMYAVRDGESFAYAANATRERPYKGTTELLTDFAADARNTPLLQNTRQTVPGPEGSQQQPTVTGQVTRQDLERGTFDLEAVAAGTVKVSA